MISACWLYFFISLVFFFSGLLLSSFFRAQWFQSILCCNRLVCTHLVFQVTTFIQMGSADDWYRK